MKRVFAMIVVSIALLLNNCTKTENEQTEKLCKEESKKSHPDKIQLKQYCIKAAEHYQQEKSISKATLYYLLAGEYEKNLNDIQNNPDSYTAYSNIAHSYILDGNIKQAEKNYKLFLKSTSISWAGGKIERDYKLLNKIYPEQKKDLEKGIKIWYKIYTPYGDLHTEYKQAKKSKQYKKAIDALSQLIKLQKRFQKSDNREIWENESKLAELYSLHQEYQKSLDILSRISSVYEEKYPIDYGHLLSWIAYNYEKLGKNEQAETYYKKALSIQKKIFGEEHLYTAKAHRNLGRIMKILGKTSEAHLNTEKAMKNEKTFSDKDIEAVENAAKLAVFHYKTGNLSEAISAYQLALNIIENTPYGSYREGAKTASIYYNLALLYLEIGDDSRAMNSIKKALKIRKKVLGDDHQDTAKDYDTLGKIYQNMKNYSKAEEYYQKALEIRKKVFGNQHIVTAQSYKSFASLYKDEKKYPKSLEYYHKALSIEYNPIMQRIHRIAADTSRQIGSVYELLKNYPQAEKYYRQALLIRDQKFGKNNSGFSSIYNGLASVFLATGRNKKAYVYAKKSFDIFLKNRDNIFTILKSKEKEKYLKSTSAYITLLLASSHAYIEELSKEHNTTKAQHILQTGANSWLNYKGSIFDSENTIALLYASTKNKKLKTQINELVSSKRYLAKLYQSLPKPQEKEAWKNNIKNTEEKISKLTNQISSRATTFKEQQRLKSIDYKDITSHLDKDELYIDYAKTGDVYYLFTLDHKEKITFSFVDANSTKKTDDLIKTFREDINTILNSKDITDAKLKVLTESSKTKLSKLYKLIIQEPLGNTLKNKTSLIISPDGALRLLPFETLFDKENGKYLIEEKEIRYIPSGKELVRLYKYSKDKTPKSEKSTIIFANPNFNTKIASVSKEEIAITPNTNRSGIIKSLFRMRFSPLPGTEEEANEIQEILKGTKVKEYEKNKATESALMKVKEPKILHIATHGFFINDNTIPNPMLKSGIALAGANASAIRGKSDGIVTALKLSGLNLKGTDLVVLSACETGVVDINSTDSVSGLSKAFIQAGAKDIVMSLWSVDDQATKELMTSFYQEMKENKNYAEALKSAKLKMIKVGRHPFYWGAFVVSGL